MINGTNLLGKDNPDWPNGNHTETIRLLTVTPTRLTAPTLTAPARRLRVPAWIAGLPRRIGARLYRPNDTEAGWWHWQVTELRGGFARSYRDVRFDVLRQLYELAERYGGGRGNGAADESEAPPRP